MDFSQQLIFSICFFYFFNNCTARSNATSHRRLEFIDYVKSNGYEGKSYHVETEDGYILRLDRISGSPFSPKAPGKPVVFFHHGILLCSDVFVIWDPKDSLVYLLADAGYDVWLPNVRGNTNGRRHKTLSPADRKFWNFTIDDLGAKDLPAHIDFALNKTGQPCITYIGYSMGTTLGYILLSEKPEYNDKISFIVNLSPSVYWRHNAAGLIKILWAFATDGAKVFLNAPDYAAEALGHNNFVEDLLDHYCAKSTILCKIMWDEIFISAEKGGLQPQDIRHLGHYFPAGTSLKIFQHYRQMMYTGALRKYDYGSAKKNIEAYGNKTPPIYNLQRTTSKIAIIWTHNDVFANKFDVDLLVEQLTNVVTVEPVPTTQFRHGDFIYHRNAKALIYDRIIELVNDHHECSMQNNSTYYSYSY